MGSSLSGTDSNTSTQHQPYGRLWVGALFW